MSKLSLVILAAGMGSRYGGLKQLDGVGPNQEVLMEYSIFDAARSGIDHVVFVIREDFRAAFEETIVRRLPADLSVSLAFQDLEDLPPHFSGKLTLDQRTKPWGTGHAVWAARKAVSSPFLAINADDYYGPQAFRQLARHLQTSDSPCMVAFRLGNTLSPSGTVSRGVCRLDEEVGTLTGIDERTQLRAVSDDLVEDDASGETFPKSSLVSMNCWGFGPTFFDFLGQEFEGFLTRLTEEQGDLGKGEFYLPAAVTAWQHRGSEAIRVETSEDAWMGVTYPEDRETVVEGLRKRIAAGDYPERLWA